MVWTNLICVWLPKNKWMWLHVHGQGTTLNSTPRNCHDTAMWIFFQSTCLQTFCCLLSFFVEITCPNVTWETMDDLWWIHQNVAVLIEPQHRGQQYWKAQELKTRNISKNLETWKNVKKCKNILWQACMAVISVAMTVTESLQSFVFSLVCCGRS